MERVEGWEKLRERGLAKPRLAVEEIRKSFLFSLPGNGFAFAKIQMNSRVVCSGRTRGSKWTTSINFTLYRKKCIVSKCNDNRL